MVLGGAGIALLIAGMALGLLDGVWKYPVFVVVAGVCGVLPYLFYRNTTLFVTDDHFGMTNLFNEVRLIPRELLSSVEAGEDFRFVAADGVVLMIAKPPTWNASQVRQLCSRLDVPFQISIGR